MVPEYQECHGEVTIAHGGQCQIKMNLNLGKEKPYLGNKTKLLSLGERVYCNRKKAPTIRSISNSNFKQKFLFFLFLHGED